MRPDSRSPPRSTPATLSTSGVSWIDGWRFLAHDDPRARDEAELRDLLLEALPELLGNPQHSLSAARVLFSLGPAYRAIALDIAEDAFRRCTAMGQALSTLGPLRCFSGDFDGGLALLFQARKLCKPGSIFERYIVSYICQNLLASGDTAEGSGTGIPDAFAAEQRPYRLVYASPNDVHASLPVRLHLKIMSRTYARSTLLWSYTICARHYADATARENVILGLAGHLRRRFGEHVIPPEVSLAIPAVLGRGPSESRSFQELAPIPAERSDK